MSESLFNKVVDPMSQERHTSYKRDLFNSFLFPFYFENNHILNSSFELCSDRRYFKTKEKLQGNILDLRQGTSYFLLK